MRAHNFPTSRINFRGIQNALHNQVKTPRRPRGGSMTLKLNNNNTEKRLVCKQIPILILRHISSKGLNESLS